MLVTDLFISFMPLVGFLIATTAYVLLAQKYKFGVMALFLGAAIIGHIAVGLTIAPQPLPLIIGQVVLAVALFVVLIYFGGNKTSSDTVLTLVGVVAVMPLFVGLWTLVGGFVLLGIVLMKNLMNDMGGKDKFKDFSASIALQSGMLDTSKTGGVPIPVPDLSLLPDRNTIEKSQSKVYAAPFFLIVALINLAISVLITLF